MHIRDQRNSNNFHGYKKIDLIINSKFIDANKHTAKELHHMDLQETIVLRIQRGRERWSHLATNYGPEGLERITHASSERHQWRWWTPSEMVSRLDLVVLDSAAAGWIFHRIPYGFGNIGVFIEQRGGPGAPEWAQPTKARLGLLARPGGLCSPRSTPQAQPGPIMFLLVQKNLRKVSLRLDSVWYWFSVMYKNMQKTATGTWHYVNRLVPKNDIKWL